MKKIVFSISALLLLSASSALAEEFISEEENFTNATETHEYDAPEDTKEHFQLRLGMGIGGGTFIIENAAGIATPDIKFSDASNFEISLVSDREYKKGFDYRAALTLQFNSWKADRVNNEVSDIMFLGEGEFAYNVDKILSPFIGWYGGIGVTDAQGNDVATTNSSQLTYDLGLFAGVSGELDNGLGYYVKYNFKSWKGFNVDNDTLGIRMHPTTLRVGASYTF